MTVKGILQGISAINGITIGENAGTINAEATSDSFATVYAPGGTMTINGGTVNVENKGKGYAFVSNVADGLTVNGGCI